MKKYNLVFIGCGAISTQIINHLNSYMAEKYDIKMIIDNNVDRATKICEKLNITPVITLHHFTNPIWFEELGGFEKEENIEYFLSFCKKVFPLFPNHLTFLVLKQKLHLIRH